MDPGWYGWESGNGWDETIFSGGYGGTFRGWNNGPPSNDSGPGLKQDEVGINFSANWGSPYPSGVPFVFCDGHTTVVSYGWNDTQTMDNALNYTNTTPLNW